VFSITWSTHGLTPDLIDDFFAYDRFQMAGCSSPAAGKMLLAAILLPRPNAQAHHRHRGPATKIDSLISVGPSSSPGRRH